nr:MAG: hypothetical protein 2 [Sobelivirales sp.]
MRIQRALEDVVRDSTPGVPLVAIAKSNAELLDGPHRRLVEDAVYELLVQIGESTPMELMAKDVKSLLTEKLMFPAKVFVKNEPHKRAKLVQRRFRVIWVQSLILQIAERVMFGPAATVEINDWANLSAKPGMGQTDGDFSIIQAAMRKMTEGSRLFDTDVSGWDLTLKFFMLIAFSYIHCLISGFRKDSWGWRVTFGLVVVQSRLVYTLPDGTVWSAVTRAGQYSGRYTTSYGNTKMRVFIAALFGRVAAAMGDDCNEAGVCTLDEVVREYESILGAGNIEAVVHDEWQNAVFCSFRHIAPGRAIPVRYARSLYRLLSKRKLIEADIMQFCEEVRHWDGEPALRQALEAHYVWQVGLHERSRQGPQGEESPSGAEAVVQETQGVQVYEKDEPLPASDC